MGERIVIDLGAGIGSGLRAVGNAVLFLIFVQSWLLLLHFPFSESGSSAPSNLVV